MPSLAQAVLPIDADRVEPVSSIQTHTVPAPIDYAPTFNPLLRCPLPNGNTTVSPDNLRQFYRESIPQTRHHLPSTVGF